MASALGAAPEVGERVADDSWAEELGQEILPEFLFMGDAETCKDEGFMRKNNITHIVNATQDPKLGGERHWFNLESSKLKIKYIRVDIQDNEDYSIRPFFDQTNAFIEGAKKAKGRVLVHCRQGRSRSSSIILAYMMYHRQFCFDDALTHLQSKRPIAKPIAKFESELRAYDKEKCEPLRKLLAELEQGGHDTGKRKEPEAGPIAGPALPAKKEKTEKVKPAERGPTTPGGTEGPVKCCACGEDKPVTDYSKSQLRKPRDERKCSSCVSGAPAAGPPKPAFSNDGSFLEQFKAMQK